MMFGYACDDTQEFMPLPVTLSHIALIELAKIRREENSPMPYLRPDAKSQFTIEYDDNHNPVRVHTFVLSTQHDDFVACEGGVIGSLENDKALHDRIYNDIKDILIPRILSRLPEKTQKLFDENLILHVNPTGKFVIGGPHGDTGLTGRKIIVDTYGGKGAHGGGAFSGKDPSKVDRSAAYMARYIAKNLVAAGVAKEILVQLSYAIGIAKPVSIYVNTYGTSTLTISDGEIAQKVGELFDLRPAKIIQKFGLNNPIYLPTAQYGHFGRDPFTRKCELIRNGEKIEKELQFFGWELLDSVELVKEAFTSVQKQG
jgi:S-adenosylmethionine synthetase